MSVGYRRRGPGRAAGADLVQNLDYPVLNEYRTVLGGLFSSIYGLNATQLNAVFGGGDAEASGTSLECIARSTVENAAQNGPYAARRKPNFFRRGLHETAP